MNLYLLTRSDAADYDQYDSAVVAATTGTDAKKIHPHNDKLVVGEKRADYDSWVSLKEVQVRLIGTAIKGTERGVICASFNAG